MFFHLYAYQRVIFKSIIRQMTTRRGEAMRFSFIAIVLKVLLYDLNFINIHNISNFEESYWKNTFNNSKSL